MITIPKYIYLSTCDLRYIFNERTCHTLKLFSWLRVNGGAKKLKWNCETAWIRYKGNRYIQIYFNDDALETLFKLTFIDHCVDIDETVYRDVFAHKRYLNT